MIVGGIPPGKEPSESFTEYVRKEFITDDYFLQGQFKIVTTTSPEIYPFIQTASKVFHCPVVPKNFLEEKKTLALEDFFSDFLNEEPYEENTDRTGREVFGCDECRLMITVHYPPPEIENFFKTLGISLAKQIVDEIPVYVSVLI